MWSHLTIPNSSSLFIFKYSTWKLRLLIKETILAFSPLQCEMFIWLGICTLKVVKKLVKHWYSSNPYNYSFLLSTYVRDHICQMVSCIRTVWTLHIHNIKQFAFNKASFSACLTIQAATTWVNFKSLHLAWPSKESQQDWLVRLDSDFILYIAIIAFYQIISQQVASSYYTENLVIATV